MIKKYIILAIVALISVNAFADRYRIIGHAYSNCMYMGTSFIDPNSLNLNDNSDKSTNKIFIDPIDSINTEFIVVRDEIADQYKLIISMMDLTNYGFGHVIFDEGVDALFDFGFILLGPNVIFDTIEDVDLDKCKVIW